MVHSLSTIKLKFTNHHLKVTPNSTLIKPDGSTMFRPVWKSNRLDLTRVFHQNSSTWIPLSFSSSFWGGFVFPQCWVGRSILVKLSRHFPIYGPAHLDSPKEDALKWVLWFQWIPVIKSENLCKTIAPCAFLLRRGEIFCKQGKDASFMKIWCFFPQPKFPFTATLRPKVRAPFCVKCVWAKFGYQIPLENGTSLKKENPKKKR